MLVNVRPYRHGGEKKGRVAIKPGNARKRVKGQLRFSVTVLNHHTNTGGGSEPHRRRKREISSRSKIEALKKKMLYRSIIGISFIDGRETREKY